MTLQLKIRSAVYCPAPKLASPSLGGWSSLWYCSLGIARGFPSLVVVSLVICSTPLATHSVPRSSDIDLLVLSLFVPPLYLSVHRGCRPFQATCLFLLLLLLPLQYRRTVLTFIGGPVGLQYGAVGVEFTVIHVTAQFHAHLISNPSLSVVSLLSLSSMAASSASWFWWYHCVCRSLVGLFADPAFIPFSMASHRSSVQLCLVDIIFFLTSLCNVGTDPCFIIWVSHPFSSRFTSHTSKVSFIIQIWIFSVSS